MSSRDYLFLGSAAVLFLVVMIAAFSYADKLDKSRASGEYRRMAFTPIAGRSTPTIHPTVAPTPWARPTPSSLFPIVEPRPTPAAWTPRLPDATVAAIWEPVRKKMERVLQVEYPDHIVDCSHKENPNSVAELAGFCELLNTITYVVDTTMLYTYGRGAHHADIRSFGSGLVVHCITTDEGIKPCTLELMSEEDTEAFMWEHHVEWAALVRGD